MTRSFRLDDALDEILRDLTQGIDSPDDHTFQIKQLLNLYELSQILNDFFWSDLQDDMKQSLESHQRDQTLAPLHLLRRCSQNVAADHMIIQQAAMQRRWQQGGQDNKPTMGTQARELLLMDKLAIKAIAPFQHLLSGHPEQPTIITYLSDRTHIHSLPYTDRFLLVGVSYDRVPPAAGTLGEEASTGNEFYAYELMAIPHEVGHYVYQHGLTDGKTFVALSKQFEDNNPYYPWCEEIFADLYGCIVAGPLSVLGLQALLTSIDRERAWKDDEVHPTPAIRFFILTEILRILPAINAKIQEDDSRGKWNNGQSDFRNVKKELDKRWATTIEQWGYKRVDPGEGRPTRVYLPDESAKYLDRLVNVERVIKAVEPIIIEFATHLLGAVHHIDSDQPTENILPIQIPWSARDTIDLRNYSAEMQALVDESARKKAPHQTLVDVQSYTIQRNSTDPDEILQQYLDKWEDQGPHGFGDH